MAPLSTDHKNQFEYDSNVREGLSAANDWLSQFSPFQFQIELPLIYSGVTPGKKPNKNIYGNAFQVGVDNLKKTRQNIQAGLESYASDNIEAQLDSLQTSQKLKSAADVNLRLRKPSPEDEAQARDILAQLKDIADHPPLTLLINPTTMTVSYSKIQQFQDRTRSHVLYHAWGEEQVKVSIQLVIGGYYSAGRGLHRVSRSDSKSYQNLMGLLTMYKNAGLIYDRIGNTFANQQVGAVTMHYDGWIYYGSFDSFNTSEDETHPNGGVQVSFEFTASKVIDTRTTQGYLGDVGLTRGGLPKSTKQTPALTGAGFERAAEGETRVERGGMATFDGTSNPVAAAASTLPVTTAAANAAINSAFTPPPAEKMVYVNAERTIKGVKSGFGGHLPESVARRINTMSDAEFDAAARSTWTNQPP